MTEHIEINILCPKCGNRLMKYCFRSKGNWVTHTRIKCTNTNCDVNTGEQCTMSDAYEALMYMYFNADSAKIYENNDKGGD